MSEGLQSDEYYREAYRESLANNEEYILDVLKYGVWDVLLTSLKTSALTEDEWQKIKEVEDRYERAKRVLVKVREKDVLSSYIGLSRALCDNSRFHPKRYKVFPFLRELEQNGRHPPVNRAVAPAQNVKHLPEQVRNEAKILWLLQSRKAFNKLISDYTEIDAGVKSINGFDLKTVTIPVTLYSEIDSSIDVTLNLATPSIQTNPEYNALFSGLHPSPDLVFFTCLGSPLGTAKPGEVVVVRRGKQPTPICAEVEHITALWRLNGSSEGIEERVIFGLGTKNSSHSNPDVLVSSEDVVKFYFAIDNCKALQGVASLAIALLSKSEGSSETVHLDYCHKLVHYFSRKLTVTLQ